LKSGFLANWPTFHSIRTGISVEVFAVFFSFIHQNKAASAWFNEVFSFSGLMKNGHGQARRSGQCNPDRPGLSNSAGGILRKSFFSFPSVSSACPCLFAP
jgi:hypothetical protein